MKYEYKNFMKMVDREGEQKFLDECGEEGWEIITYEEVNYNIERKNKYIKGLMKRVKN